jgi:hypothetical protein
VRLLDGRPYVGVGHIADCFERLEQMVEKSVPNGESTGRDTD